MLLRRLIDSIIIVLLVIQLSCDPNEIVLPTWNAEFLVPLIEADFDFRDISLSNENYLSEDSTGALTAVYTSDIYSARLIDLINIPDVELDFDLPAIPNELDDFQFDLSIGASQLNLNNGVNVDIPPFNVDEIIEEIDISSSLDARYFREYSIGWTLDIFSDDNYRIRAGAIAKYYQGLAAIYMPANILFFETGQEGDYLSLDYNYEVLLSGIDDFSFFKTRGHGWGGNLGATFAYKEKWFLDVAVNDFGAINFKKNTQSFKAAENITIVDLTEMICMTLIIMSIV